LINDRSVQELYSVCIKSAEEAGKYLLNRFQKNEAQVKSHHKHDVKLDVDIETEELIIDTIKRHFPDHGFICEESGRAKEHVDQNWIVDPLDGSVNFFMGIPHFCTSIAFKKNKTYIVGAVFDPVRNEMFSALRGSNALLNGSPITRRTVNTLEEAVIAGGFFKVQSLVDGTTIFEKVAEKVKKIRFFGSAALDLCYLACGRVNGCLLHCVSEWDIAAASLIAEHTGVKFEITENNSTMNVFAADPALFDELKACIKA